MLSLVPTTQEIIDDLKPRIRKEDRNELAALGHIPDEALQLSYEINKASSWSFVENNKTLLCFGVTPHYADPTVCVPWMITSDEAFIKPSRLLRHNKPVLDIMTAPYRAAINIVHKDNHRVIKWLRWCGFEFPTDIEGVPENFIVFTKEVTK